MGFIVKKTAIRVDGRKLVVVKGRSNLEKVKALAIAKNGGKPPRNEISLKEARLEKEFTRA